MEPTTSLPAVTTGKCSICEEVKECPFETPDDPPFFPKGGGFHCEECEIWLLIGDCLEKGLGVIRA